MNAITISQPYASLIADGKKFVENRTWLPPDSALGKDIAIHAGKGTQYLTRQQLAEYPHGCIVAVATLAFCLSKQSILEHAISQPDAAALTSGLTWNQLFLHEHTEGPFCWVLTNIRKMDPPFPTTGRQGLWRFTSPAESAAAGPSTPSCD